MDFHPDLGLHRVIEALKVLDVEGADDMNARGQEVLHILIAFGVLAAGDIGVGQFIHQGHLGAAAPEPSCPGPSPPG